MRYSDGAGLLGVVHEIALRVVSGSLPDNLNGIFVGTYGAIGPETVKQRTDGAQVFRGEFWIVAEAGVRDVVVDANGEMIFGFGLFELVENPLDHRRRELFRREAVAAPDNARDASRGILGIALHVNAEDILVERFAEAAGFLGAIENGDGFHSFRNGGEKCFCRERAVKTYFEQPDSFAGFLQGVHGLFSSS